MNAGAFNDPNAINLQGLSAQAESVYQFEITGNNLQQSAYKKLLMDVVAVPMPPLPLNDSAFKIVAPENTDTRKAFDDYLDSVNPGSDTSISHTSDPVRIEALDSFVDDWNSRSIIGTINLYQGSGEHHKANPGSMNSRPYKFFMKLAI